MHPMKRISLFNQVRFFAGVYYQDKEFQEAFGKEVKIRKFQIYLIFFYFCSSYEVLGYPILGKFDGKEVIGLINYKTSDQKYNIAISDVLYYLFSLFLYTMLLNSKIRTRLNRHSKISHETTRTLYTCELLQIGIRKSSQGSGIFKEMLDFFEDQIKYNESLSSITVTAYSENKCRMYEYLGFKLFKHTKESDIDVWVLSKEVKA